MHDNHNHKIGFLFPGQGSQIQGMGKEIAAEFAPARETYQEANDIMGFDISDISWNDPDNVLNKTEFTQPALLVHSIAVLRVINEKFDIHPAYLAGHSLGEISALVAGESLSFSNALKLVRTRGILMKKAGEIAPGGMTAILGLDASDITSICEQASTTEEVVQVANDNCPGQIVISGDKNALSRAMNLASELKARKIVPLPVSIAAHSPLMASVKSEFKDAVEDANISNSYLPVISNVTAKPMTEAESIQIDLVDQLTSPVRWTDSMQYLLAQGVTGLFEVGTGKVLSGLMKRIDRKKKCHPIGNPDDLSKLASLTSEVK